MLFWGFPSGSAGKESTYKAGDLGSNPGLGRSHGEGKGYLLQYSGLENSMDCIVHGVTESWTWLSDFHLLTLFLKLFLEYNNADNLKTRNRFFCLTKIHVFLLVHVYMLSRLSHVWLCDPLDCSLSGSSVHGILQARILEWIANSF